MVQASGGLNRRRFLQIASGSAAALVLPGFSSASAGQEKDTLPVLAQALKHPTSKVRLFAIVALDKLGEKARPALAQIKAAAQDSDDYVKRVATTVMGRLEPR